VSTFAGTGVSGSIDGACAAARFNYPCDIKIDAKDGSFFVSNYNGNNTSKISPQGLCFLTLIMANVYPTPHMATFTSYNRYCEY
jgi:hypothetical protein